MVFFFFIFFICSGFCHTLEWNSHGFTRVPHPDPSSHLPLHPLPLGFPSAPGPSACLDGAILKRVSGIPRAGHFSLALLSQALAFSSLDGIFLFLTSLLSFFFPLAPSLFCWASTCSRESENPFTSYAKQPNFVIFLLSVQCPGGLSLHNKVIR